MWAGRVDRDSDPVLQEVQKQTQVTTAAGTAVGIVNEHVRLPVEATYFLFSTSRPELGPQQPPIHVQRIPRGSSHAVKEGGTWDSTHTTHLVLRSRMYPLPQPTDNTVRNWKQRPPYLSTTCPTRPTALYDAFCALNWQIATATVFWEVRTLSLQAPTFSKNPGSTLKFLAPEGCHEGISEHQQILLTTVQNFIVMETWQPEVVHPWQAFKISQDREVSGQSNHSQGHGA